MTANRRMKRKDVRRAFEYAAGQAWLECIATYPAYNLDRRRIYFQNRPVFDPDTKQIGEPQVGDKSDQSDTQIQIEMRGVPKKGGSAGGLTIQKEKGGVFIIYVFTTKDVPYGMDVNDDLTEVFEDYFETANWLQMHRQSLISRNEGKQETDEGYQHPAVDFNLNLPYGAYVRDTPTTQNWQVSRVEAPFTYDKTIQR